MTIYEGLDGLRSLPPGTVMSIGNFDGMHRGHARILDVARQIRDQTRAPALAVATFEPHPLTVLRPEAAPPRLTPAPEKQRLIEAAGADVLIVLPPSPVVLELTAERFWAILRDEVRPTHLVEGHGFTFGKGRGGNVQRLVEWSQGSGIEVRLVDPVRVPLLNLHVTPVSSSLIRWLIAHGRVRDAAVCLGRPVALQGEVVKGHQRGRTIGVPTANLDVRDQLVPLDGVYAGRCEVDGRAYPAAVSIGTLPTFGEKRRQVEAHLIGYRTSAGLYGQVLHVELLDLVREQWRFGSVEVLKVQIARDLQEVDRRSRFEPGNAIAAG